MQDFLTFLFHVITGRFRNAFEVVRHLRIGTQLAFVGLGLGSYAVHQYPKELWLAGERGYYAAMLSVSAQDGAIPLSKGGQQRLAQLIATLERDQVVELRRRKLGIGAGYNAWAVAQMAAGLGPNMPIGASELANFFQATVDRDCNCWRETPQSLPHTGATGWIVYAQAKLGIKTERPVLSFLLSMQSPDGWWALYPAKPDIINAGTYPTAWATLALCSQLPLQKDEPPADVERLRFAIENALNWLSKNETTQQARWMDYPANTPAIRSASITGLVLHTMKLCGHTEGAADAHRRWLANLPFEVTTANDTEISNTNLYLNNEGLEFDRTRHYVMEWALVGIVDAYASGTPLQRAAALQWIERILKPDLVSPEVRNQRWIAAELQYALRHLQSHVRGAGPKANAS